MKKAHSKMYVCGARVKNCGNFFQHELKMDDTYF